MPDVSRPERPAIGRFLPPIPRWIPTSLQRLLGTVATLGLLLPLVTVEPCNGPPQRLTGLEFYAGHEVPVALVSLLVIYAIVMVQPWRPVGGEAPAAAELGHAALLGAWVAVAGIVAGFLPLFSVFSRHVPEIGYIPHAGGWFGLFFMLTLIGLVRLPTLLRTPPPLAGVMLGASQLLVPPIAVFVSGEVELEVLLASSIPMVVVGIPLAVAVTIAGLRARRGDGAVYVLLTGVSVLAWLVGWTVIALRLD